MTVTTFDGMELDTSLGIQVGREMQHWRYGLAGLSRVGSTEEVDLPVELFSGYLREGLIYLHDQTPPQEGEWFVRTGGTYTLVVITATSEQCEVAIFRNGEWNQTNTRSTEELMRLWRRCEPLQISSQNLFRILRALSDTRKEVSRLADSNYKLDLIRQDLNGIQTYLDRAKRRATDG